MTSASLLTIIVIVVAVGFDFVNGFHDAANSIATIVETRILKPLHAVMWAAFFNFIAVFIFGTGVAKTVGSGMIAIEFVTPVVILCGLIGAIAWGILTWWLAIPTSSSHALLGGYAGAAMCKSALSHGLRSVSDPILVQGWTQVLLFILVAPILGLVLAQIIMRATMLSRQWITEETEDKLFGRLQLASSACLSLMHGSNDAQKTAGIIAGALLAGGLTDHFVIPFWVLALSYSAMGLGTFTGGWRIVRTLGHDLTRIRPNGGFAAETAAALSILFSTWMAVPVSTTHVTTGAIVGVGAARSVRLVRWNLAGRIAWAWVLTLPAAGLMGAAAYWAASHLI